MKQIFQKLSYSFANQLTAKWQGINLNEVYLDWANNEAMGNLTLGAINYGIEISCNGQHAPNRGEFIANCRHYNPVSATLKIERRISPEQIESNRKRIAGIAEMLSRNKRA
jgi:hypothetical protein